MRRLGGSLALPSPIRDFIRKPLDPHPAVPATFPRREKEDCGATIPRSALAPVNPNFSSARGEAPAEPHAQRRLGGSLALPTPFRRPFRKPVDPHPAEFLKFLKFCGPFRRSLGYGVVSAVPALCQCGWKRRAGNREILTERTQFPLGRDHAS